ncbi:GTP-dependent dephospho-CoA kinase family protein [Candidatus Bathyarchaeota archaeon]|nr:GTP-dependent dephospho-CoA kinase family protein [Candidatus Bathyarchaeota archaeon]
MSRLGELIDLVKPREIISIGDIVSRSILEKSLPLNIFIVDNKSMRELIEPINANVSKVLHLINPAGTISRDSWRIIDEAINSEGLVKVLVEGEEDLLTIVAALLAPVNSMVVYGQPNEGIVVINVTEEIKKEMREIINKMIYEPEN